MEVMMNNGLRSKPTSASTSTGRITKSHREAERKRRERINAHLATFRTLVPNTNKMDKASLLMEVVRKMRELRKYADNILQLSPNGWMNEVLPGEVDQVGIDEIMNEEEEDSNPDSLRRRGLKVSFCCEDRPGLMSEVQQAIKRSVNARAVRADMATVGGRTKSVVVLEGEVEGKERSILHSSLKEVVHKNNSPFGINNRFSMGISFSYQ